LAHAIRAQGVAELFIFHNSCAVCCEYRIVRDNVSEQIRECLEAAENCARKAATLADSSPTGFSQFGATLARIGAAH
jgi:hypothetical protein